MAHYHDERGNQGPRTTAITKLKTTRKRKGERRRLVGPALRYILDSEIREDSILATFIENKYPGLLLMDREDQEEAGVRVVNLMALKLVAMAFDPRENTNDQLRAMALIFDRVEGKVPNPIEEDDDAQANPIKQMSTEEIKLRLEQLRRSRQHDVDLSGENQSDHKPNDEA